MSIRRVKVIVKDIADFLGLDPSCIYGPIDGFIDNIVDAERVSETSLDWINPSNKNGQYYAENSPANVILAGKNIIYSSALKNENKTLFLVENPKLALINIINQFFVPPTEEGIHPTAIINPRAKLGKHVSVGPYTIIGEALIGDDCVIGSHVEISSGTTIGNNVIIKPGCKLGGAGFGFERDINGNLYHFPQIGGLIIGDNVEIGSNTCIDRGALSDTVIGDYTKINNLCHIAHNNKIGKNVVITGCVNISGSNVIEDDVWIAPNSSIRGWVRIGKKAVIGMGAVVVKNIPEGETWVGNPAKKLER